MRGPQLGAIEPYAFEAWALSLQRIRKLQEQTSVGNNTVTLRKTAGDLCGLLGSLSNGHAAHGELVLPGERVNEGFVFGITQHCGIRHSDRIRDFSRLNLRDDVHVVLQSFLRIFYINASLKGTRRRIERCRQVRNFSVELSSRIGVSENRYRIAHAHIRKILLVDVG